MKLQSIVQRYNRVFAIISFIFEQVYLLHFARELVRLYSSDYFYYYFYKMCKRFE